MAMVLSILKMYSRPLLIGLILVIVGLVLGLIVGWGLMPVHWTYAPIWEDDYVVMVSTMYAQDNDLARARWRLENTLEWRSEEAQTAGVTRILERYQKYGTPQHVGRIKVLLNALGGTAPSPTAVPGASPTALLPGSPTAPLPGSPTALPGVTPTMGPVPTPGEGGGGLDLGGLAGSLLPLCCVVILVAIVVAVLAILWTNRAKFLGGLGRGESWSPEEEDWSADLAADQGLDVSGPHMRFTARYSLGQNNYEESFSVESAAGGFFGECGVSAAERLGKEGPDKVTAFDLWLFDVASRETITKVLLSDWGYKDDPLRTQLISRGGVILAERGKVITLETQNLRVDIKVVDFDYSSHEGLPENSFFGSLTLDMIARMKES